MTDTILKDEPGQKTTKRPATEPGFRPPRVIPGDMVYWYESTTGVPLPAIVTGAFGNTISCSVVHRDFKDLATYDGVRYLNDPTVQPDVVYEEGLWTPRSAYQWPD